jgi:hypothetical protein
VRSTHSTGVSRGRLQLRRPSEFRQVSKICATKPGRRAQQSPALRCRASWRCCVTVFLVGRGSCRELAWCCVIPSVARLLSNGIQPYPSASFHIINFSIIFLFGVSQYVMRSALAFGHVLPSQKPNCPYHDGISAASILEKLRIIEQIPNKETQPNHSHNQHVVISC